jgi:two-component system, NtrC family, sensor histidine kinase HydH
VGSTASLGQDSAAQSQQMVSTNWGPIDRLFRLLGFGTGDEFRFVRVFALLSLLCIAAIGAGSAYVQSQFLTRQILVRDATVTQEFLQSIVHSEDSESFFGGVDSPEANAKLQSFFAHILHMPGVLAANVYDTKGKVLWSSDKGMLGAEYDDNDELKQALGGQLKYESGIVGEEDKQEHAGLKQQHMGARFVETYAPIMSRDGMRVVGVVEVYKVPEALDRALKEGLGRLWLGTLIGGSLLFGSLFWIVRRAANVIKAQHDRLMEVEALAAIGETAAAVTHSIRNPLASIRAAAETALSDDLDGARESARDIISEADRLTRWTKELLLFSKKSFDHQNHSYLDLADLVKDATGEIAGRAETAGVKIDSASMETGLLARAVAEPAMHVLNSILTNALDAMPKGGVLSLRTRRERSGDVLLSIQDTGPGLSREMMAKVMKPFYSTKNGGTGVGLPLAQQIMHRFGGSLTLREGGTGLLVELRFKSKP